MVFRYLFAFHLLSKYPNRRISRLGQFGILALEIVVHILRYVITSSIKDIVDIMTTCNFFRSVVREFLSPVVQQHMTPMTYVKYRLLSKMILYNHDHLDLSSDSTEPYLSDLIAFKSLNLRNHKISNFSVLKQVRCLKISSNHISLQQFNNLERLRVSTKLKSQYIYVG